MADRLPIGSRVRIGQCEGILQRYDLRAVVQFDGVGFPGYFDPKFIHLVDPAPIGDTSYNEMEGMRRVPDGGEPWVTRVKPPHPRHVSMAAGAVLPISTSLRHAYMVAYTLDDAGLLNQSEPVVDTDLRDRLRQDWGGELDRLLSERGFLDEDDQMSVLVVFEDLINSVVAPVLAERDKQALEIARLVGTSVDEGGLEHPSIIRGIRFLLEQKDDYKRALVNGIAVDLATYQANFREIQVQLAEMIDADERTPIPDLLGKVSAELDLRFATRQQYAEERDAAIAERDELRSRPTRHAYESACEALERRRVALVQALGLNESAVGFGVAVDQARVLCEHLDVTRAARNRLTELVERREAELDALKAELRPRLNGLMGALCGQGSDLVVEMRRAIALLDAAGGQPDTEATEQPPFLRGQRVRRESGDTFTVGHVEKSGTDWKIYDADTVFAFYSWASNLELADAIPVDTEQPGERDAALHEALQEDAEVDAAEQRAAELAEEFADRPATPTEPRHAYQDSYKSVPSGICNVCREPEWKKVHRTDSEMVDQAPGSEA